MRIKQISQALAFPLIAIAGLEAYARLAAPNSDVIAPPSQALLAFLGAVADGSLFIVTGFTLLCAALGLAMAAVIGVLLGVWLGLSRRAAQASFFSIEFLRTIPSVALIPLAMMLFGFGLSLEVSIVAFSTVWPILILTQSATRQIPPVLFEVARALELRPYARLTKIILPAIAARLFVALRLSVAIALVVAVTVEIVVNPHGMGYAIMIAQQSMQPDLMLAWLFWIAIVGYAINEGAAWLGRVADRKMGGA